MTADAEGSPGDEWACEECGWTWPLRNAPPAGAECDNCGGRLEPQP